MFIALLSARIDNLKVTDHNYNVPLSVAIDAEIVEKAGLKEYQEIGVYNRSTGRTFKAFVVPLDRGSGRAELDGDSLGDTKSGDELVISVFSYIPEKDLGSRDVNIIHIGTNNSIKRVSTGKI